MKPKLTWLHLSDWHQEVSLTHQTNILTALIHDIEKYRTFDPAIKNIDFVVFSGDLANRGKPANYLSAKQELIDPVLEAAGLKERYDRLFIVPGNHDVDWDIMGLLKQDLYHQDQVTLENWFKVEEYRKILLAPMVNYNRFVHDLFGNNDEPVEGFVKLFTAECQKKVAVIGINTAWLSGLHKDVNGDVDDEGWLRVVESQFNSQLAQARSADIRIVLMHHPYEWFNKNHTTNHPHLVEKWLEQEMHFVLRGHNHEPMARSIKGPTADCIIISAGSLFSQKDRNEMPANGYNIVQLDFLTGKGAVFARRYNNNRHQWEPDLPESWRFDQPKALKHPGTTAGCKILLVDNANRFLRARARVLETVGKYVVCTARSCAEAENIIQQNEDIDLALIDVRMQHEKLVNSRGVAILDHSGIVYARKVVERGIPVVMMTVHEDDTKAAIEALTGPNPACNYVFKDPIDPFLEMIERTLRNKP